MRSRAKSNLIRSAYAAALLVAGFLVGVWALPSLELREGGYPRPWFFPVHEKPGDDSFFVLTNRNELSQVVLYHDFGRSIENARAADVLFLGNSRMPLGLREEFLVPRMEELGIKAFSLACGHAEGLLFGLDLIRKHDLRPKLVVAVGGPHFYRDKRSEHAQAVVEMSRFDGWKEWVESKAGWQLQGLIHTRIPRLDYLNQSLHSKWLVYRSERTGWWRPVLEPNKRIPTGYGPEATDYSHLLGLAREFAAEMQRRDSQVLLTLVPGSATQIAFLPYFEEQLNLPYILPQAEGLILNDGAHLTRESSETFTQAFWELFIQHPSVRSALELDALPVPGRE